MHRTDRRPGRSWLWLILVTWGSVAGAQPAADEWRKAEIRSYLSGFELEQPVTESDLEALARGDFEAVAGVPPAFRWVIEHMMNGEPVLKLSPVGLLLIGKPGEEFVPICTVILTRPNVVLTARHCAASLDKGQQFKVFFPHEGLRDPLDDPRFFCETNLPKECSATVDDIAIIPLAARYTILRPAKLGAVTDSAVNQAVQVSGFGYCFDPALGDLPDLLYCGGNGTRPFDGTFGIWREGRVRIAECGACTTTHSDAAQTREACIADLEQGLKAHVTALSIDSGGPMFRTGDDGEWLVGLARHDSSDCPDGESPIGGKYVDLTDAYYADWLSKYAFSSAGTTSTAAVPWEVVAEEKYRRIGSGVKPEYSAKIDEGMQRLVITLNHEVGNDQVPVDMNIDASQIPGVICERHRGVEVCSVNPNGDAFPDHIEFSVARADTCGLDFKPSDEECLPRGFQMAAVCIGCTPESLPEE